MKKSLFVVLFCVSFNCFAEDPPMGGWNFTRSVTLNGREFLNFANDYANSYLEQDGYALVQGRRLHYWLYDTITYHNGNAEDIYNRVIPSWVEGMGYVIDFDNIEVYNPNSNLASSVRALMQQRGCDVSVALVTGGSNYDYVVINEWFKSRGVYKTTVYPLYK